MKHEKLLEIVRSGVMAPSADNQHVFQVELTENTIRLWPTSEFTGTTERHRRILGLISLGAVVENMKLRAAELELTARAIWFPAENAGPIVQLELYPTVAAIDSGLAKAIPFRHTNRRMYHGPGLSDGETTLLNASTCSAEGTHLIWLRGDARRRALSLIWQAESERFRCERLHQELFSSIRFDLSWKETATRALPPGALEIEPPMRPLFKALRHWPLMRGLSWIGGHHLIGLRAGWLPAWQAPALGLLATSLPVEQGAVVVGAAFERLWLQATLLNLAVQPLAASVVLPLQSPLDQDASSKAQKTLADGWKQVTGNLIPLMVFRVGRADAPKVRTTRRNLQDYLVTPRKNMG